MFVDGAQVAHEAVQGILERVDALAAKIGTTAQRIWDVYVAQAKVEAIRDAVLSVILLIVAALSVRLILFFGKKFNDTDYSEDGTVFGLGAAIVVLSAVIILCLVFSGVNAYAAIPEWFNPQYWAFQHLTADLKNLF